LPVAVSQNLGTISAPTHGKIDTDPFLPPHHGRAPPLDDEPIRRGLLQQSAKKIRRLLSQRSSG
jgi:hypothetical protein